MATAPCGLIHSWLCWFRRTPRAPPERTPGEGEQVRDRVWMRLAGNRVLIVDGLTTNVLDELERAP